MNQQAGLSFPQFQGKATSTSVIFALTGRFSSHRKVLLNNIMVPTDSFLVEGLRGQKQPNGPTSSPHTCSLSVCTEHTGGVHGRRFAVWSFGKVQRNLATCSSFTQKRNNNTNVFSTCEKSRRPAKPQNMMVYRQKATVVCFSFEKRQK